jgi:hypothetical protein
MTGPVGPMGPSNAFNTTKFLSHPGTGDLGDTATVYAQLTLPEGSYVVTSRVSAANADSSLGAGVSCTFNQVGVPFGGNLAPNFTTTLTGVDLTQMPAGGGTVTLKCQRTTTLGTNNNTYLSIASLTAIQVQKITQQ